jgi:hypothetical protein
MGRARVPPRLGHPTGLGRSCGCAAHIAGRHHLTCRSGGISPARGQGHAGLGSRSPHWCQFAAHASRRPWLPGRISSRSACAPGLPAAGRAPRRTPPPRGGAAVCPGRRSRRAGGPASLRLRVAARRPAARWGARCRAPGGQGSRPVAASSVPGSPRPGRGSPAPVLQRRVAPLDWDWVRVVPEPAPWLEAAPLGSGHGRPAAQRRAGERSRGCRLVGLGTTAGRAASWASLN